MAISASDATPLIGLLGGTFDPVHYGHLRPALEAVEALGLSELRLVPCAHPPHRDTPAAPATQRLAMVALAAAGEPRFRVDGRELGRVGPSYTVDTLAELRAELGAHTPLVLLLGMDAYAGLTSWHRWELIPERAHLAVMTRPGSAGPAELAPPLRALWDARVAPAALREAPAGRLCTLEVTALNISASQVRAVIGAGRSARFLTPDAVCEHIAQHGLYRGGNGRRAVATGEV